MGRSLRAYLNNTISAAPLATFRIAFGLLLLASIVRFWAKGWIEELYIKPRFFFSYYGFEWVKPLGTNTYWLFVFCGLCALLVALGLFYRVAAAGLFLSFTYIELMDKSTYLNHYYFVSLAALLLLVLPAGNYFAVDTYWHPEKWRNKIPRFTVDALRLLVGLVYFYAGLAKLNSDWLLEAMPLRIWLPAKNDTPLIGELFNYPWVAYAFSWFGAFYDLTVSFLLSYRPTRLYAYLAVIVFHVLTAVLFPIGMFPYVMIVAALIFFPAEQHEQFLNRVRALFRKSVARTQATLVYKPLIRNSLLAFLGVFFLIQLVLPFRYLTYPGELFWTEEGYRFSWRVMLMEKMGHVQFRVVDARTSRSQMVNNYEHLSTLQEKMMSTQPDMIVEFAHYLHDLYTREGMHEPKVYADTYVTLNGRLGKTLIDPAVDLSQVTDDLTHKSWILPFNDEISGL